MVGPKVSIKIEQYYDLLCMVSGEQKESVQRLRSNLESERVEKNESRVEY